MPPLAITATHRPGAHIAWALALLMVLVRGLHADGTTHLPIWWGSGAKTATALSLALAPDGDPVPVEALVRNGVEVLELPAQHAGRAAELLASRPFRLAVLGPGRDLASLDLSPFAERSPMAVAAARNLLYRRMGEDEARLRRRALHYDAGANRLEAAETPANIESLTLLLRELRDNAEGRDFAAVFLDFHSLDWGISYASGLGLGAAVEVIALPAFNGVLFAGEGRRAERAARLLRDADRTLEHGRTDVTTRTVVALRHHPAARVVEELRERFIDEDIALEIHVGKISGDEMIGIWAPPAIASQATRALREIDKPREAVRIDVRVLSLAELDTAQRGQVIALVDTVAIPDPLVDEWLRLGARDAIQAPAIAVLLDEEATFHVTTARRLAGAAPGTVQGTGYEITALPTRDPQTSALRVRLVFQSIIEGVNFRTVEGELECLPGEWRALAQPFTLHSHGKPDSPCHLLVRLTPAR